MAETTTTPKLPDNVETGRAPDTKNKNTETDEKKYNKEVQLEGKVTVIELKGGNEIKDPKQYVEDQAKILANKLGKTVKVKLKMPKKGKGGSKGTGSTPRDPGTPESTTPGSTPNSSGNGNSNYSGNDIRGQMYDYLTNVKGIDRTHALGILANMNRESTFNPKAYNPNDRGGPSGGLFQWHDKGFNGNGRFTNMTRSVPNWRTNWQGQIDYALNENEGDSNIRRYLRTPFTNSASAATGFMDNFERPFGPDRPKNINFMNNKLPGLENIANSIGSNNMPSAGGAGGGGGGAGGGDDEETYESKEAKPDGRDNDINKRAVKKDEGDTEEAKKLRKPPEMGVRSKKGFNKAFEGVLGISNEDSEGTEQGSPTGNSFQTDQFNDFKGGIPREFGAQIPPMESILMGLPNQALGQFIGQIPGPLQGLIPPGLVPGISGNSPVGLNNLMQLVGGGAVGQAASQIIRSTAGGVNLPRNVTGLQGIPISQVLNNSQIPNNNTAAIANALGTISKVSTNRAGSGIPVDLSTLTRSIQLVLRSSGMGVRIPTNVLGIAGQVAAQAIGAIINQALGGLLGGVNLPILPSNLSIPNAALISGLGQFLPAGVAQNIFTVGQLTGLLPGNLQNQIPNVPSQVYNGNVPNAIEQNRLASPEVAPNTGYHGGTSSGNQGGGSFNGKEEEGVKGNTGGGRNIDYDMKISKYLTLGQVTIRAIVKGHKLVPHMGLSVDEIIENLSGVAKNCFDPIHEKWGPAHINSGFRENSYTDHGRGCALDISFGGSHAHLFEIAKWCADGNIPYRQIILERQRSSWLHVAYKKGEKSRRPVMTQLPGGSGENSRYSNGLVNYYGGR